MMIEKYFWDLNRHALRETAAILKDVSHSKFNSRFVALLSRCDKAKEIFSLISKKEFIRIWPSVKSYWLKMSRQSDFRDWWETVYEELLSEYEQKQRKPRGLPPVLFVKIGKTIREARIENNLSQKALALRIGMKQPDISKVEEGRKNITLATLARLCKVLKISNIELN